MSSLILQHRCTCFCIHSTLHTMNLILSASVVFHPISVHPHRLSMPAKMHVRPFNHPEMPVQNKHNSSESFSFSSQSLQYITAQEVGVTGQTFIDQAQTWTYSLSATRAINPGHDLPSPIAFMYWSWACCCL